MEPFHGTTIVSVRRGERVALGGDGQVTMGAVVVKSSARKVRRLHGERVLAGFAGATADAFTLFERFEAKLDKHQGHLQRAAVELAKDWRSDRILRRLEAMLAVADTTASLIISGNGDVLEPEYGILAIGSGGAYAQAAARALLEHTELSAADIVKQALTIAGDICIYTNQNHVIEALWTTDVTRDVVIIGAGLVGLALAVALSRAGLSVAIVDRGNVAAADSPHDAGWDARVYAISPGSAAFLHECGVWQRLAAERMAPIEAMEVFGDDDGHVRFDAYELGERALAWIVENRELNAALVAALRADASIEVLAPVRPTSIAWHATHAEVGFEEGASVSARLVVGADGIRSWARGEAGIEVEPRSYAQSGVVANFAIERPHRGRAFQWFIGDEGVIAWLPLPGKRMSMVWSAPDLLARELVALSAGDLAQRVAEVGKSTLGALHVITPAAAYPLAFLKLASVIAPRFALIGDAAHGIHPLAGQGVNLGFGDASALSTLLAGRGPVTDVGAGLLLRQYALRRSAPVLAMQAVTDGLVRLFDSPVPWVRSLRNRGMRAVDAIGPLKRLLSAPALR